MAIYFWGTKPLDDVQFTIDFKIIFEFLFQNLSKNIGRSIILNLHNSNMFFLKKRKTKNTNPSIYTKYVEINYYLAFEVWDSTRTLVLYYEFLRDLRHQYL